MPDFALDLGFERIKLLQRRSVDWEILGDVPTNSPDLTSQLRAMVEAAADPGEEKLEAIVFLPENQVLFETVSGFEGDDAEQSAMTHLEGRTPYDLTDLRLDWERIGRDLIVAAVAVETLDEAERFALAHGVVPTAITVQTAPENFPRAPEFRDPHTPAVFRSARSSDRPQKAPSRDAKIIALPAFEKDWRVLAGGVGVAASAMIAAVLLLSSSPTPNVETTDPLPVERPALVEDLAALRMPDVDSGLASRRAEPPVFAEPLPETGSRTDPETAAAPGTIVITRQEQETAVTPGVSDLPAAVTRPSALGAPSALVRSAPTVDGRVDTGSARASFPLVGNDVATRDVGTLPQASKSEPLSLSRLPTEFLGPSTVWKDAGTIAVPAVPTPGLHATDAPGRSTPADNPSLDQAAPGAAAAPSAPGPTSDRQLTTIPDAPDLLEAALPPEAADEMQPFLLNAEPSRAPDGLSLRPSVRPDPPSLLAIAQSARPTARPAAPRPAPPPPVAVASTAGLAENKPKPKPEPEASSASAGVASLVVTPPRPQGNRPSVGPVARSATHQNALEMGKVNLIGVFGSDSSRRALVRLANGRFVRVKVGDRVNGGKVAAIGSSNLRYVKGGQTYQLTIPSG